MIQTTEEKESYIVEYPPEEETMSNREVCQMQPEVELALITKVKETLSLKRTRLLMGHDITEEEKETQFKKMKESSDLSEATADLMNVRYNFDTEMAEEAGLTMPPTSP